MRQTSLKELWEIGEHEAATHGKVLRREDWRLVVACHLAESRKEAIEDMRLGSGREVTEYFGRTLGHPVPDLPADRIVDQMVENNQWIVGTPEDCIAGIERFQEMSGGFGGFMVRVEDWASRDKTLRSYELLARYVLPRFQGTLAGIQASNEWARDRREQLHENSIAGLKRATDSYFTAAQLSQSPPISSASGIYPRPCAPEVNDTSTPAPWRRSMPCRTHSLSLRLGDVLTVPAGAYRRHRAAGHPNPPLTRGGGEGRTEPGTVLVRFPGASLFEVSQFSSLGSRRVVSANLKPTECPHREE